MASKFTMSDYSSISYLLVTFKCVWFVKYDELVRFEHFGVQIEGVGKVQNGQKRQKEG